MEIIPTEESKMTKHVLITGASSGIGLTITKLLAENGFSVIAGVHHTNGIKIIEELNYKNILPIYLDVTDNAEIKKQFEQLKPLLEKEGLYGLINNAGILMGGPLEFFPSDFFKEQLEVNVVGVLVITQAALPYLRKQKSKIINIGSTIGRYAMPFLGAYSASKFALRALTQILRLELNPWNIDVTYIEAGSIKTPLWQKGIKSLQDPALNRSEMKKYYGKHIKAIISISDSTFKFAASADVIGKMVLKCLMKDKLKPLYLVGRDAKLVFLLNKFFSAETISTLVAYFIEKKVKRDK